MKPYDAPKLSDLHHLLCVKYLMEEEPDELEERAFDFLRARGWPEHSATIGARDAVRLAMAEVDGVAGDADLDREM